MNCLILIITLLCLIVGILLIIKFIDSWDFEWLLYIGIFLTIVGSIMLFIFGMIILFKPLEYRNFKIKYETIEQMQTNEDDIRDATFTQNLIEINKQINHCKEYQNDLWIGILENKKICKYKLLKK